VRLTTSAKCKNETLDISDFEIRPRFQVLTAVAFISTAMYHWASSFRLYERARCFRNVRNPLRTLQYIWNAFKIVFFGNNSLFNTNPMCCTICRPYPHSVAMFSHYLVDDVIVLFTLVCFFKRITSSSVAQFVAHFLNFSGRKAEFWNTVTVVLKL